MRKERRSYIILVLICLFLCGGVFVLSVREEKQADRRWCGTLLIEKTYPPPKPANAVGPANRLAERVWLIHEARLKLFYELGC